MHNFLACQGNPTEGGYFFAHSYKLLSAKAQHRTLLVHFFCTVLLFHSGPSVFLISFPTFLVFLFSFSFSRCQAITTVLYHTISYCTLFLCVLFLGLYLDFTWGPYLGYITSNVRRPRAETDGWEEQKADSQVSEGTVRKTLLKAPDGTVWLLLLKDAGLRTRMWYRSLSSRMEQEGKDLFMSPFNFCFSEFCIFVGLRVLLS